MQGVPTMKEAEMKSDTTDAQQRGFDDFPSDEPNPYPEGTNEHVLWLNGWNIAFMVAKREAESDGR